jgi:hypothetical protein
VIIEQQRNIGHAHAQQAGGEKLEEIPASMA